MSATLYDLATRLLLAIGRLLDREANLTRGHFHEETMTDTLTDTLTAFADSQLLVNWHGKLTL